MTPSELVTQIRQRYNATGDTFFSDAEIYNLIWQAQNILATETLCIRSLHSGSTVASTQSYSFPAQAISIKRVTYAGAKLEPINFREDDSLTGQNQATTSTGTPAFYYWWNDVIYLRPIPSAVGTINIFSYDYPQEVDATSTLEVPERYHFAIIDFCLEHLSAKDKNYQGANYYGERWREALKNAIVLEARAKTSDSFRHVNDIETLSETFIGTI